MTGLDGLLVAISISEPGEPELAARGLTQTHLRHAFVELARQLLAADASLSYGGDLRTGGYTRTLHALLRTYRRPDRPAAHRNHWYLAPPIATTVSTAERAELAPYLTVGTVPAPEPAAPDESESVSAARGFTAMRQAMTRDAAARVLLGGRLSGQAGRWPGLTEEAYLARKAGQPQYLAGGLGGATARLTAARTGEWPAELTTDHQLTQAGNPDDYQQLLAADLPPTEPQFLDLLTQPPVDNGLDDTDNQRLATTTDLDEINALILRGLHHRFPGPTV